MSKTIKSVPDQAFFHIVTHVQSVDELISNLYQGPNSLIKEHFLGVNQHIKTPSVRPGLVVVVTPPGQTVCTKFEADLATVAAQMGKMMQQLTPAEADFLSTHYELLYNVMAYSGTANGVAATYFNQHKKRIELLLKQLERLYVSTYNKTGKLNQQRFYLQRKAIFSQLETTLKRMVGRTHMGLNLQTGNLKNSLGLSTKSILHQWNRVPGHVETLPDFTDNYAKVTQYGKWVSRLGYAGLALDVGQSGMIIHKACTEGTDKQCNKSKYVQGGRLTGSVIGSAGGGILGGSAGYGICNLIFGFPSGGTSIFWCGLVGAGAGGYIGGSSLGNAGSKTGDYLFESLH